MGIPEEELQEEAPGVTFMQHSSQPPCMQAPPESGSGASLPPHAPGTGLIPEPIQSHDSWGDNPRMQKWAQP